MGGDGWGGVPRSQNLRPQVGVEPVCATYPPIPALGGALPAVLLPAAPRSYCHARQGSARRAAARPAVLSLSRSSLPTARGCCTPTGVRGQDGADCPRRRPLQGSLRCPSTCVRRHFMGMPAAVVDITRSVLRGPTGEEVQPKRQQVSPEPCRQQHGQKATLVPKLGDLTGVAAGSKTRRQILRVSQAAHAAVLGVGRGPTHHDAAAGTTRRCSQHCQIRVRPGYIRQDHEHRPSLSEERRFHALPPHRLSQHRETEL